VWLSVWSEAQIGFAFLVPAYAGCPGKEDVAIVHYHTRLMAAVPGQPALTRKVKPVWI